MVRLRLSDFYDPRTGDYDLTRLSRAITWVNDTGARPLVCLNPARITPPGGEPRWDAGFAAAALRLVALRRGGPHLRYYELFDAPLLTGQFATVSELAAAYNDLAARVLAADPEARVAGPAWPRQGRVCAASEGADTLHFLAATLRRAQPLADEAALRGPCGENLRSAGPAQPGQCGTWPGRCAARPEMFVTTMAMNSARRPGRGG